MNRLRSILKDELSVGVPIIAVLLHTDAFAQLWSELAASVGATLRVAETSAGLAPVDEACAVLLAAGGGEVCTPELVAELVAASRRPVALVGAELDHRQALALGRSGADDCFLLPCELERLRAWLTEQVSRFHDAQQAVSLAASERTRYDFGQIIGRSPKLLKALESAGLVIPRATASLLITGETGTGKQRLVEAIHYNGPRGRRPLVEVNCTALPETLLEAELFGYERGAFTDARAAKPGLFEVANGGTLFLDEIGDISLPLQAKLLKVLESRQVRRLGSVRSTAVDVRIVAATHVNLANAVAEGRFRRDLYYRLQVVPIHLPPLRERGDDVLLLAHRFIDQFADEFGIPRPALSPEARRALLTHSWPGNIRELRNAIERAVLLGCGGIRVEHLILEDADAPLPEPSASTLPFPATLDDIERAAALAMVQRHTGNKSAAAEALGISRVRLYRLLRTEAAV